MRASVLFSVGKIKPYSRTAPQFPPFLLQLVATPLLFRDKSPNALQNCRKTKEEEALWLPPLLYDSLASSAVGLSNHSGCEGKFSLTCFHPGWFHVSDVTHHVNGEPFPIIRIHSRAKLAHSRRSVAYP